MPRACLLSAAILASSLTAALADCQCLANGKVYHHGELACLKLPNGNQLARCDMVLNNSAWKKVSDGCPQAELLNLSTPAGSISQPPESFGEHRALPLTQPSASTDANG
ncbi:hypothetical protein [Mesorhizobium sp. DCY119]|uniref:hypothetical protein n=1 Tax=Mesorhizobium sp. DCY119 TaxID=2108445 RepID=UPI0018D50CE2|nr:hypothetical protein [Mesorhizobium sp. DCY119]